MTNRERRYNPVDWDNVEDLGKVPDGVIAKRLRVSPQAVHGARTRRGIPPATTAGRPRISEAEKKKRERLKIRKFRKLSKREKWDWSLTDGQMASMYAVDGKYRSTTFFNKLRILLDIPSSFELRKDKS